LNAAAQLRRVRRAANIDEHHVRHHQSAPRGDLESSPSRIRPERLVLALTQVFGATAAVATHGDSATLDVARAANAEIRVAVAAVAGRVIKSLGEGLLLSFPADRVRDAVNALRTAREKANDIWRAFDSRCEMHVKVTMGTVLVGSLGLADDSRPDVWGLALHKLFKQHASGFVLLPELAAALGESSSTV
jgi:class 3 adenylate cyclase